MWQALCWASFMGHLLTSENGAKHNNRNILGSKNRVMNFPGGSKIKNLPVDAGEEGDMGFNPLQYSCLENPMDREAWWAIVHGAAKSRTRLSY